MFIVCELNLDNNVILNKIWDFFMKKFVSKILVMPIILVVLFLSNTSNSYGYDTLFVGTHAPSTSTTSYFPYYFYDYGRSRVLYLPEELFGEEAEIYSFAFNISSVGSGSGMDNFAIYMRNYNGTTFASTSVDTSSSNGFVRVWSTNNFNPSSTGWCTFEFDNPFIYDGTSSLEVVILHNDGSYSNNTSYSVYTYYDGNVSTASRFSYAYQDGSGSTTYPYSSTYAVQARFEFDANSMKYLRTETMTPKVRKVSDVEYVISGANVITEKPKKPLSVNMFSVYVDELIKAKLKTELLQSDEITNIKVYYTFGSDEFSAGNMVADYTDVKIGRYQKVRFNTPATLREGDNYFWITYTVNPKAVPDGFGLYGELDGVEVGRDKYEFFEVDPDDDYTTGEPAIIEYNPISMADVATEYTVCSTHELTNIKLKPLGTIIGYQWEVWNNDKQEYEYISGADENNYDIYTDDVMNGQDLYRFTALAPEGMNDMSLEISFSYDMDLESVQIFEDGELVDVNDTHIFCVDDELVLTSEIVGDYDHVNWQYTTDGESWFNISLLDMETANTPTLTFIASSKYKGSKIRLAVFGTDACGTVVYSNEMSVDVFKEPLFLTQPSQHVSLCEGETFYTSLNFDGEEPLYQRWYKDGQPLGDDQDTVYNKQELEFESVDINHAGTYYYVIEVETCYGTQFFTSDTVTLSIKPRTEIHTISPSVVRANEGEIALFEIEASYSATEEYPHGYFQWYRYDVLTQTSTKIENSYRIKGANSPILVISFVNMGDYTFNGSYYYCVVRGECSGQIESDPLTLIPAEQIAVIKQPVGTVVCPDVAEVRLNTQVFSSEDDNNLRYQWYYDNTELVDGPDYTGVTTPELSIVITNDTKFPEAFYCRIWLEGNDPAADYVQTDDVFVTVLDDYQPVIVNTLLNGDNIDINNYTIELAEGEELHISLETANPATDVITWSKLNPVTAEYEPLIVGTNFDILFLQTEDAGKYAINIKNECKQYLVAEFEIDVIDTLKKEGTSSISELTISSIEVAPNPVSSKLNIKYESTISSDATISIMDMTGAVVYSFDRVNTLGVNEISLDINKLNIMNGTYFVRINSKGSNLIRSFIVSK